MNNVLTAAVAQMEQGTKLRPGAAQASQAESQATIEGVKAANAPKDEALSQQSKVLEMQGQRLTNQKTQQDIVINS